MILIGYVLLIELLIRCFVANFEVGTKGIFHIYESVLGMVSGQLYEFMFGRMFFWTHMAYKLP